MVRHEKKTDRAEHLAALTEIEGALKEQERESEAMAAMQSTSTTSADDGVQRREVGMDGLHPDRQKHLRLCVHSCSLSYENHRNLCFHYVGWMIMAMVLPTLLPHVTPVR